MRGIVLAGGKGSRLRPFTYSGAKQLVPIANVPVLHYAVRQLVEAGVTDIALVVGDTEAQVRGAMGDGGAFGARFTYVQQGAPLGIAHAVLMCREFARDDSMIVYLGDNVLLGGIGTFAGQFRASAAEGAVILREVPDPRAFGVAVIEGERLTAVVEKPAEPPSALAVIGVYGFRPGVFEVIARQQPSGRGELEIADTINGLLAAGLRVDTSVTTAEWIDTGKMDDILAANRSVMATLESECAASAIVEGSKLSGMVRVGAGARLERCVVRGPVVIGAGAVLRDCEVGPAVAVGDGCRVARSRLENTIVMESSEVLDSPGISDSMIGRFAHVSGAPRGVRLTLGDHSRVERPR